MVKNLSVSNTVNHKRHENQHVNEFHWRKSIAPSIKGYVEMSAPREGDFFDGHQSVTVDAELT